MDERAFEGYRYDFQIIMVMLRDVSIHHFTSLHTKHNPHPKIPTITNIYNNLPSRYLHSVSYLTR